MSKPKKSLGQHFLNDIGISERMAKEVASYQIGTVLEIGPGRGALTQALADYCSNLIALELDGALVRRLSSEYAKNPKVTVLEGDGRDVRIEDLHIKEGEEYVIAANLPYNSALPILLNFLDAHQSPKGIVCMLQLEVARALCAPVGKRGFTGVMMQSYAEVEFLFRVPASAFYPMPKVESAVIKITPSEEPEIGADLREEVLSFVFRVFRTPRKQMRNALANGLNLSLEQAGELADVATIDSTLRPSNLTLLDWQRLYHAWRN